MTRGFRIEAQIVISTMSGTPIVNQDGRMQGHASTSRDATATMRSDQLLQLEREVNRILLDAESTEAGLVATLRTVCEFQGWPAGHYWRLDETDGVMRIHAAWSGDDDRIGRSLREALEAPCAPGEGLVGHVVKTHAPLWVADLRRDERFVRARIPGQTGWNSALLGPVLLHGRVIGVIEFMAESIPEPGGQLLDAMKALGTQVGSFCAHAMTLDRLRDSEERYSNMVDLAAIGMSHVDVNGRFLYVNPKLCEMLGYTRDELLNLTVVDVSHPEDRYLTEKDRARLETGEIDSFKAEKRYLRKDGTPIWVHLTVASRRAANGRRLHDISIIEDITERREAQSRIQYLATHDEMTGLANRTLFNELLTRAIARERRLGGRLAVMFVDLDRFKIINDSLGHEGGDQMLKEMAGRLNRHVRSSDVLGRFGGDEFVLLLNDVVDRERAAIVARHLLLLALKPFEIAGQQCRVTASIGIALYPEDAEDTATLLKYADLAMYRAKEEGKNNCQFYSADLGAVSETRLRLETGLRDALVHDELSLHYQAKVDLTTHEIRGVEALMRWSHPQLGPVSPTQFIPIAEESGLIVPMGYWALEKACAQTVAWLAEGLPPISMAVNLSTRQFLDAKLVETIERVLTETGMPAKLLELEITESVMLHDIDSAVAKLTAIRDLGVRLAIDDFGTGYSSLAQLKRFPIDALKIDRSFIRGIPTDRDDMAITEAILALGKTLGVTIIAEGVETDAQRAFLKRHECHEMQGFHFSRPVPAEEFAQFYRAVAASAASGA